MTKEQRDRFATLKGKAFDVDQLLDADQIPDPADPKTVQNSPAPPAVNVANTQQPANTQMASPVGMLHLVTKDSVLKELGIEKDSPEHVKILDVIKPFLTLLNQRLNKPSDEDRLKSVTSQGLYAKVEAELVLELKKVLKPEQFIRLQQIHWQNHGIAAISDSDLASLLGIQTDQHEKIAAAKFEFENQRRTLEKQRLDLRDKGENIDEVQKKIQDLESERTRKYNEILSPDQREKFVAWLGKSFEMPQQPNQVQTGRRRMPIRTRPGGLMAFALGEPILKELGIDKDAPEVAEIRKLSEAHSVELRQQMREMKPPENEKAKEIESKLQAKYNPDLKKLLTAEQFTRLRQINWQSKGVGALDDADVANTLEITKEQQEQLSAMNYEMFQASQPEAAQSGRRPDRWSPPQ